jgi:hypothetical protein
MLMSYREGTVAYHSRSGKISFERIRPAPDPQTAPFRRHQMFSRGKGSVSDGAYTPGNYGLAAGLCIAFVLVLVLGLYTMRRRILSPCTGNSVRSVANSVENTPAMSELSLLDLTNKRRSALSHNSVCSQDGGSRGSIRSITSAPDSRQCSVCKEPYLKETALRQLPCGHQFHRYCVDPWLLRRHGSCPLWCVFKS